LSPDTFSGETVMGWIVAVVALSLVMTVMTIAELRKPVSASTIEVPALSLADRVIALFALGTFTLATVNGLILVADKTLP
jgi:hypothetical protein